MIYNYICNPALGEIISNDFGSKEERKWQMNEFLLAYK